MSSALAEPSLGSKPPLVAAADPFGEALKDSLVAHLRQKGYTVDDSGTSAYYDAAAAVAKRVQADSRVRGLLFCGTGMGVGMIANKFSGVRAATCENVPAARCSRAINDANVLCLGGKVTSPADANDIADAWLAQEHAKAPGDYEWWSADVEAFLGNKWPAIRKVEEDSREH